MSYRAELLANQGLVLGMYDGRYTAPAIKDGAALPDGSEVLFQAAHCALDGYARQDLALQIDEPYVTDSAVKSFSDWNWAVARPSTTGPSWPGCAGRCSTPCACGS